MSEAIESDGVVEIRSAEARDLPVLMAIYNHYIENTVITFDLEPVDEANRRAWMAKYHAEGPYRLLVADMAGIGVVGYATSSRMKERAAYDISVETSIYVADGFQRKGLGTKLYQALFAILEADPSLHRAYAGATLPNAGSVALHERFGFEKVGHFREVGRKFGKFWDVGWWERALK